MNNDYDLLMSNTIREQFEQALARESNTLYAHWQPNKTYQVFFRLDNNRDANGERQFLTCYSEACTDICKGSLVDFREKSYLILNEETAENNYYHRHSLLECNTTIDFIAHGLEWHLPAHVSNLRDANDTQSNMLSVISGNNKVLTSDCEASRALSVNTEFQSPDLDGQFRCVNRTFIDGIAMLFFERVQASGKEPSYSIAPTLSASYVVGSSITPTASTTIDGKSISNAAVAWTSSDPEIAVVNADGTITFTAEGQVTITATWSLRRVSSSVTVSVVPAMEAYGAITGKSSILVGSTLTLSAVFYGSDGTPDEVSALSWSLTLPDALVSKVSVVSQDGQSVTIKCASDNKLIGKTFTVVAETESGIRTEHNVRIDEWTWL